MNPQTLLLVFVVLCEVGTLLALRGLAARQGSLVAWFGGLAAAVLVGAGAVALYSGRVMTHPLWSLPGLTTLTLTIDPLSAVFMMLTGLVLWPASIFAGRELRRDSNAGVAQAYAVMWLGLCVASVLVLLAGDALSFLMAWEVMSILCYFFVASNREEPKVAARAGYLLLAMGEAGVLAVALGFLVLGVHAGALDFASLKSAASTLSPFAYGAVFLLMFFGFGVKAGLAPVNFWLPDAYTAAPRLFVPLLAGATLNLGLYGIVRVNADLLPAVRTGSGLIVLVIGTASALLGILYATTDNDLKTMLAHSSIENAGLITAAFGAGMVFAAAHHPALAAIAWVASLYHLINHSLYKTLLFVGAGAVESETGTRHMDRLGGLIKGMPVTAFLFLIGTLSIAALPPFNGFVSEWLTLQTMLRSAELSSTAVKLVFAMCGAGLALTAALAVTCFVKAFAMSFLGMRRLEEAKRVTEPSWSVRIPMAFLAVLCLALGMMPTYVIPALDSALAPLAGGSAVEALVPPFFASKAETNPLPPSFVAEFHELGAQVGRTFLPGRGWVVLHRGGAANPVVFAMSTAYSLLVLLALLGLAYIVIRLGFTRRRRLARRPCWDGGVRRLLPEMTYTATGFSNPVRVIFDAVFRPTTVEDTRQTVEEHFRTAIYREKERVHLVEKIMFRPVRSAALGFAGALASIHHGRINAYAAYALLTLLIVLLVFAWLPAI